jgi:hypothetical protein
MYFRALSGISAGETVKTVNSFSALPVISLNAYGMLTAYKPRPRLVGGSEPGVHVLRAR